MSADPFERAALPDKLAKPALANHVFKTDPRVFFIVFRTLNNNMMVYRALGDRAECFWLILDPKMRDDRRKRGITHDKENLSTGETVGYGFQYQVVQGNDIVTINNVRRPIFINYNADKSEAKGKILMQNEKCTIRFAVVHVKGLLSVTHVDIYASHKKKMLKETVHNTKRK